MAGFLPYARRWLICACVQFRLGGDYVHWKLNMSRVLVNTIPHDNDKHQEVAALDSATYVLSSECWRQSGNRYVRTLGLCWEAKNTRSSLIIHGSSALFGRSASRKHCQHTDSPGVLRTCTIGGMDNPLSGAWTPLTAHALSASWSTRCQD
jgi:hypothetical protein